MNGRDPHQALKNDVLGKVRAGSTDFVFAKLQWGKDDIGYSMHVSPNSYTTAGYQITDFLYHLGFRKSQCSFVESRRCFVRWVDGSFDLDAFAALFDQAFKNVSEAERNLQTCGYFLEQPEGWGYFFGKPSVGGRRHDAQMAGDGHLGMSAKRMKESEDDVFQYVFTWLESQQSKGWVIHYRPKHFPLSSELQSVLEFLSVRQFAECPEYDFEGCFWRSIAFRSDSNSAFDSNAGIAHGWFDAHAANFAPGLQKLLTANAEVEKVGLNFLPFQRATVRLDADIERRTTRPKAASKAPSPVKTFDVAISFAGSERQHAEQMATILRDAGVSVFYDEFYPEYLWGKNLVDTFDEIYRRRARYCVIFVSKEYRDRAWTNHERQSAQARALREKGKEYILPIQVDDAELDGMPPTIGYVPLERGIKRISEILINKLKT